MARSFSTGRPGGRRVTLRRTAEVLARGVELDWHAGAQVSVRTADGRAADIAVGRTLAGGPMTSDVLVPWFCAAKPLLVVAAARLVDAGRLGWDDPVARFVPQLDVAGKRDITLRHALRHSIGLRRDPVEVIGLRWDVAVRTIARTPLEPGWAPGVQHSYLPFTCWYVVGELLARVSGVPLAALLRDEVLGPLGLDGSHVGMTADVHEALRGRLAPVGNRQRRRPGAGDEFLLPVGEPAVCLEPGPASGRGPCSDLASLYARLGLDPEPPPGIAAATWRQVTTPPEAPVFDHRHQIRSFLGLGLVFEGRRLGEASRVFGPGCGERTFGHRGIGSVVAYADPGAGVAVAAFFDVTNEALLNRARIDMVSAAVYEDVRAA